jgi:uncharacterized protein YjiS (DUF1127 family)
MTTIETNYRISEGRGYEIEPSGSRSSGASMPGWLVRRAEKRHSRMALPEISDDLLKDIGLSRIDANYDARRHFYDQ